MNIYSPKAVKIYVDGKLTHDFSEGTKEFARYCDKMQEEKAEADFNREEFNDNRLYEYAFEVYNDERNGFCPVMITGLYDDKWIVLGDYQIKESK